MDQRLVEQDRALRECDAAARSSKTVEQIAHEQGVGPLRDIAELRGDWPEEDDIDEFFRWLRQSRAA